MRRSLLLAAVLSVSLFSTHGFSQSANFAVAAFGQGSGFEQFMGPWRAHPDGTEILFATLCVDGTTREKYPMEVIALIPDGATLAQLRSISTTAVVNGCAPFVTVARGAVLLPSLQFGQ